MNLIPSKIGAENKKKVAALGGLVAVLIAIFVWNSSSSNSPSAPSAPTPAPAEGARTAVVPQPSAARGGPSIRRPAQRNTRGGSDMDDFKPTLKLPDDVDVSKIDPTLKLELLAKLKTVDMEGGARSLFDFGQPPPPPPPKVDPIKVKEMAMAASKAAAAKAAEPPKPAGPPPPPPIPLKFYGYSNGAKAGRRAFFLNGDDIFVAGENDMIQNRYKVIRIGVNSAVVEDTTNKHQQTLPLVEELPG